MALISTQAWAHIDLGVYKGVDENGQECSINFKKQTFARGMHHPLNEEMEVEVDVERHFLPLTLKHPPLFNTLTSKVTFNHDALESIEATNNGAMAMHVVLKHDDEKASGPQSYILTYDNWREAEKSKTHTCSNLIHQD